MQSGQDVPAVAPRTNGNPFKPAVVSRPTVPGVFDNLGRLPPATLINEAGLAALLGKCTASIKAAVSRGELPRPVRLMGKNTWTVAAIVRHHEDRMANEARKFARFRN